MLDRWREPWTPDDDRRLRDALAEGATLAEIAAELGRTRTGVRMRCQVLRSRLRRGPPVGPHRRAELIRLLAGGLTLAAAARATGRSHSSICELARRLAREGLLTRVGTKTRNVRYVVRPEWFRTR